jgi:HSP20 family protein
MHAPPPMGDHFAPAVDIFEEADAIVVHAELPGVEREDMHVCVEHGLLTIRGERKLEGDHAPGRWRRLEIAHGTFARSFALPRSVVLDEIEAELESGVLTLRIPKRPPHRVR